jgi:hypothetical protein
MLDQLGIKLLIIASLAAVVVSLLLPARGSRASAIRKLSLLLFFCVAVIAVIFPQILSYVAEATGVGRGADLLLYGFVIVQVSHMMSSARKFREMERQQTELARRLAISEAGRVKGLD